MGCHIEMTNHPQQLLGRKNNMRKIFLGICLTFGLATYTMGGEVPPFRYDPPVTTYNFYGQSIFVPSYATQETLEDSNTTREYNTYYGGYQRHTTEIVRGTVFPPAVYLIEDNGVLYPSLLDNMIYWPQNNVSDDSN